MEYNKLVSINEKLKKQVNSLKQQVNQLDGSFNYQKIVLKQYPNQRLAGQLSANTFFTFKLADSSIFKDEKEDLEINEWLSKMRGKMTVNASLMPTEDLQMIYIESQVGSEARKHIEGRLEKDTLNQFTTAKKMLDILKQVYCNSNWKINPQNQF